MSMPSAERSRHLGTARSSSFTGIASNQYKSQGCYGISNSKMDTEWFREALNRAGRTQADLARYLGLPPSAISRMVSGGRQMKLQEAVQTAAFLGVPQDEVLRRAGDAPSAPPLDTPPARRGRPPRQSPSQPPMLRPDAMPIRSAARRGGDQQLFLEADPVGYTGRPSNLAGVRGAYALYMIGDSMEPRYESGWLLHVHPFKPPTRGRDVVVLTPRQAVLIKQFVGWTDDALTLRQLNPEETLRIPRGQVIDCHLIVGVDQEG
jgi:phage repressor protein C with HTH and peptisase S24 domain